MCFLGIDIGTSSICGVVYNSLSKEIVSITKENNANILSSNTWERIQDVEIIFRVVCDLIDELRKNNSNVRGIGFSGQMHGILYINKKGKAVSPLYTWQDSRGSLLYKDGLTYAAYLSKKTGLMLSAGFGLVTHFYNQENGLVPNGAEKICTVMDYIAMRLTGRREPLMDCSNADSIGFFDKKRLIFNKALLMQVGIDSSILPSLGSSSKLLGYYKNIPIYTAIGDNQASFLGSVRLKNRSIHLTVGTSSQLSVYSHIYTEIPLLDTRPLPGGGYILVGAALCGGASFSLLKRFFFDVVKLCTGKELTDTILYKAMTSISPESEIEDGLYVETSFDGTRQYPEKRGQIMNISYRNWTPENLILGFLKGISQELFDFYRSLPPSIKAGKDILIGSGNGLRKNAMLCQILENYFGLQLHMPICREEAALGACIYAMVISGYLDDFSDFEYR